MKYFGRRYAHCDAALNRWNFVDQAGKLFERLNGDEPLGSDKQDRQTNIRHSTLTATKKLKLTARATKTIRSGITAA